MPFRLTPAAFLLFCAFASVAQAETAGAALNSNSQVSTADSETDDSPVYLSAEQVKGSQRGQVEASGNVELRKSDQAIFADFMNYDSGSRDVAARGSVRLEQDNNVILGPQLQFNLDTNTGEMPQPVFTLGDSHARGSADLVNLEGRESYVLRNVDYTTCPAGNDDWLLKIQKLDIDRNTQLGEAHNAHIEFKGVPILYSPWMNFSLNGQRKTGLLSPVFGSTVQGGNELTLPFYWNIAPDLDATIAPRIMTRRGVLLNTELRYLEPNAAGEIHYDVLPNDRLANSTRSRFSILHTQDFGNGFAGSLNFNRVSDDDYFRDLSDAITSTSQTNLIRQGVLSYNGGWWQTTAQLLRFQTLQDRAAPLVVPYDTLPQISFMAERRMNNADVAMAAEFVDFHHPTLVNGRRLVMYPTVSYPLLSDPAFYLTPKVGVHSTYYQLGDNNVASLPNASRTLPIFSLDGGMTLERTTILGGKDYVQTLEPRMFYVYIPYRDQTALPNFDSALADFSFAQIFTENRFFGSDRIGDANQVTLALTSRLLDPYTGASRLSMAVGQRFSASTPRVNLPGTVAPTSTKSDILFGLSGQVTNSWSVDSIFQYSPNRSKSEKFNVAASYQPEVGKVLNLGYRYTRDSIRQVDVSAQWPIAGRWHGVGSWNYSLQDGRLLEAMGGLEYNHDCWTLRLVMQRFATSTQQVSTGLFLQLELSELVSVGSDPLSLLRQDVPGYTKLNGLNNGTRVGVH